LAAGQEELALCN